LGSIPAIRLADRLELEDWRSVAGFGGSLVQVHFFRAVNLFRTTPGWLVLSSNWKSSDKEDGRTRE
jgi:hypothetical protein